MIKSKDRKKFSQGNLKYICTFQTNERFVSEMYSSLIVDLYNEKKNTTTDFKIYIFGNILVIISTLLVLVLIYDINISTKSTCTKLSRCPNNMKPCNIFFYGF